MHDVHFGLPLRLQLKLGGGLAAMGVLPTEGPTETAGQSKMPPLLTPRPKPLLPGRVTDGSGRVAGRVVPQKKPVNIGYGRPDGLNTPKGWWSSQSIRRSSPGLRVLLAGAAPVSLKPVEKPLIRKIIAFPWELEKVIVYLEQLAV
jgi:hypothetical protein